MLRSLPTTPLVCLCILVSFCVVGHALADDPEKSLEILLKPNQTGVTSVPKTSEATPQYVRTSKVRPRSAPFPGPVGPITKVKPPVYRPCGFGRPPCILPQPKYRQWEMSGGVFFANLRGKLAWPRFSQFGFSANQVIEPSLQDQFQLPGFYAFPTGSIRYQFRPRWGIRYEVLGGELTGSGYNWEQFQFGPNNFNFGTNQDLMSKWEHIYHRVTLVYDAVKTCSNVVSIYGGWVHTDDKVTLSCNFCGQFSRSWSKGGDSGVAGVQIQRCINTRPNGGTFSWDHNAGAIFMDDVIGYDVSVGMRYSVLLGSGRSGYLKGGYRGVELKRTQEDVLFTHAMDGGFFEMGLIF